MALSILPQPECVSFTLSRGSKKWVLFNYALCPICLLYKLFGNRYVMLKDDGTILELTFKSLNSFYYKSIKYYSA